MSNGIETSLESEKYHVIRELGRGGMGVVYLAEDRQLRRQVALKVLYDYLNRDRAFVERFQEEARSVSTLHHPNIVCVHGLERTGDIVAIDMEFVEGASLDQLSAATPHMAAAIARDVLSGLAACHQIGIVHRDVKPSNILLNQTGQSKITDFGLATAYATHMENTLQGSGSSGFYMGTPRYMPVQAWEGGNPEPFWDLYSFGVVLHELISGRPAFKGDNPVAVMRKQLMESLPPLDSIVKHLSPEFARLVDSLLVVSREESPDTTAASALESLRNTPEYQELKESDGATTVALPSFRTKRKKPRHPGRNRAYVPLILAGALAVVAGLLFYRPPATPVDTGKPAAPAEFPASATAVDSRGTQFFEVLPINREDVRAGTWMVERDDSGLPRKIIGFNPVELWSLQAGAPEGGGRQPINGYWGGCVSTDNQTTHHGVLSGYLLWEPEAGRLTVHILRKRLHDNVEDEVSLAGRLKPTEFDRAAFIGAMESSAALHAMLYRELVPRPLAWALAVEEMLPALPRARVLVPFTSRTVTMDGALSEPVWTERYFTEVGISGELSAQSPSGDTTLLLRWDQDALYIATHVSGCGPSPRLEVGLLPAPELPSPQTGRFFAYFEESGRKTSRYFLDGREAAWDCAWESSMKLENGELAVELKIPQSSLKGIARIHPGKRWRANVRITSMNDRGVRSSVVDWGAPDHNALEHGALFVFE